MSYLLSKLKFFLGVVTNGGNFAFLDWLLGITLEKNWFPFD